MYYVKAQNKVTSQLQSRFYLLGKGSFDLHLARFGPHWECYCEPQSFPITRFPWDVKNCIRLYVKCNETLQMQNSALNSRPTYSNE